MDDTLIWGVRALIFLLIFVWGLHALMTQLRSRNRHSLPSTPTTPTIAEKATPRPPGHWSPSCFRRPQAPAHPDFTLTTTPPLPYRPFRYGPKYNITMGLRPMAWNDWIELDREFPHFHAQKAARIRDRGEKCCRTAPEAREAAMELLEELTSYLTERYPSLYAPLDSGRRGCKNLDNGETTDLDDLQGQDPMAAAGLLIQDDLAIMIEQDDGQYYLLAGAILLAGFWRLSDKFGMPLSQIHTSGDVPGFKEKLEKGMMSFFRRLQPEKPMLRNNYFIQVDDNLAWSESIGSEDADVVPGWRVAEKDKCVESHWFRSERQSLRRLPRTGAVVFTIRTYFVRVTEMCEEPGVPGRLASAVRSWGEDVSVYKGRERYGDVLLGYLDKRHEEQVRTGVVGEGEETVSYPY